MQEYAEREWRRRDRRNAVCRSKFKDSDVQPPHIVADTDLTYTWALDRSMLTAETSKQRRCRLVGEMAKYSEVWSLSEIVVANAASSKARRPLPPPTSSLAAAALRRAQEEAERIIRER